MERPAPTHMAMMARGNRICRTMVSTDFGQSGAMGKICASRMRATSIGDTAKRPTNSEAYSNAGGKRIRNTAQRGLVKALSRS